MRIGLDLDGVVYDWHSPVYTHFVALENYQGTFTEFWTKYIPSLPKERQEYIVSLDFFYLRRTMSEEDLNSINKLASLGDIYYITARAKKLRRATEKFLRMNNLPYKDNLIMSEDKLSYCKLLQIDFFVDDFSSYVEEIGKFTTAFLFAKPWNRDRRDLPTIYSLEELYKIIKEN